MAKKSEVQTGNTLKFGKRTYFFDVRKAQNGNKYLRITESRFIKEGERTRNSLTLFKDDLEPFLNKMQEVIESLGV